MGEPIEKISKISSGYEIYENETLGMSLDPSLASVSASPTEKALCSSPDHYAKESSPADILSLATRVPVSHPERFGGRTTLPLRTLILSAGSADLAKAKAAQEELVRVLEEQIATHSHQALSQCLVNPDEDLVNALALLATPGLDSASIQRRKDGALILQQHLEADSGNKELLRGIMVAAASLDNHESIQLVVQLAKEHPKVFREIHDLPHRAKILAAIAKSRPENSTPETKVSSVATAGGGASAASVTGNLLFSSTQGSPSPVRNIPASILSLVQQTLQNVLPRNSEPGNFLTTGPGKTLRIRLAEIATHPELTPVQLTETLRIAVLSRGLHHPEGPATEAAYGELRPYAAAIAQAIAQGLKSRAPAGTAVSTISGDRASRLTQEAVLEENFSRKNGFSPRSHPGHVAARDLTSSLRFFGTDPEPLTPVPGTQVTSSTVAAGMMGINFFTLAGGSPLSSPNLSGSSRPEYFVEGPGAAEAETHSGSEEGSSQQNPDSQDREQSSQADAYLA